jgi:hypothetical protein
VGGVKKKRADKRHGGGSIHLGGGVGGQMMKQLRARGGILDNQVQVWQPGWGKARRRGRRVGWNIG